MTLMNWFNYLSLLIFTPLKILELVKMARLMPKKSIRFALPKGRACKFWFW